MHCLDAQLVIYRSAFRDINIRKGRRQDEGRAHIRVNIHQTGDAGAHRNSIPKRFERSEAVQRLDRFEPNVVVRAGVVDHPVKWVNSGYHEIQQPPKRYRVIDLPGLFGLCGFSKLADFQQAHRQWVKIALRDELSVRDARWSEAVAVGNLNFIEKMKSGKRGAVIRSESKIQNRKSKIDWAKLTETNLAAKMRL